MCYSTDNKVNPKREVTYEENFPYGTNGYRTDCNYIPVIYYASYNSTVFGLQCHSSYVTLSTPLTTLVRFYQYTN